MRELRFHLNWGFTKLSQSSRQWRVFWMQQAGLMQTCCSATGSAIYLCLKPYRMDVPMDHSGATSRSPGESWHICYQALLFDLRVLEKLIKKVSL